MKKEVNNCVGCEVCLDYCQYKHTKYYEYYCDECGSEETLYDFEGEELCSDCILNRLTKLNE